MLRGMVRAVSALSWRVVGGGDEGDGDTITMSWCVPYLWLWLLQLEDHKAALLEVGVALSAKLDAAVVANQKAVAKCVQSATVSP